MAYRYLWTPQQLGPVEVRNRIVFSAHLTNYARDGLPTEQHAAYYGAAGRGWHRAHHHRGALDPPDRLAVREADPRLPPRRDPRLPHDHRRRPPPPRPDLRPDQPQRRPGLLDVLAAAGLGAVAGRRPAVPRGPQGGHPRRDRRDRRRLRPGRRTLRRGRVRRHRAAVLAQLDRAWLPLPRHQPPHRRLRRVAREPGSAARRDRRRGARGDRTRPGARRADLRRRADRGRHHDRRRGAHRRDRRGHRARSTTSTPRSASPRRGCS